MSDIKPKHALREPENAIAGEPPPQTAQADSPLAALPKPEPEPRVIEPENTVKPATAEETWAAFGEAQAALAHGFGEFASELLGIAQSGAAAGADAAVALIGAKTLTEAVEIHAKFASRGFDAIVGGSVRLSEIGIKAAGEATRPMLSRFTGISAA